MPPRADGTRRAELLDRLIDTCAAGGIGGRSLREVAAAVGTSHRMLLHHFGSRDELLLAIVHEVERRQLKMLDTVGTHRADAFAAMWADIRRPAMWPFERLFFECYSRAAQGEEPFAGMLPNAVEDWLTGVQQRAPGATDPAVVRLCLAASRGLLLDLVATGDEAAVDAAAATFTALLRR
jgi:AcrR family transcriptional regulator